MKRFMWSSIIAVICLCIAAISGRAQTAAASVSGTVTDTSNAVVQGARISLRNTDTDVEQASMTGSSGTYSIVNIAPGNYTIEVKKSGFNAAVITGVVLAVDQSAVFNFSLKIGNVEQSISVSAEATEVQSSTAELGAVINTKSVNDLPLNGRNFTQMLTLTPGVSRITVAQNGTGGAGSAKPTGVFTFPAVDGQRNRSNMFNLDGINDLGSYSGTYNYEPIVDDIQEFKVQTHSDQAEFGQVAGGVVNIVTKSGTNTLHGTVWEFLRNSRTDARNYFLTKVNPLHQNQFGAMVSGPVIIPRIYHGKNKTFFLFTYEAFRQSQATQNLWTTPTTAQLGGDFSNLLAKGITIYDPNSTVPDPAKPGQYLRTAFTNNQIPSSEISPLATLYAKALFPAPNATGLAGGQNLIDTTPLRTTSDSYTGRIDQAFGDHDLLFGRISEYNQPSITAVANPNSNLASTISGYNIGIHEAHTFGASAVLEVYFGRNIGRNVSILQFPNAPANFAATLVSNGFSSLYLGAAAGPYANVIPPISIPGYIGQGNNSYQGPNNSNIYEYGGSFTKILNRHTIKTGGVLSTNNFTQPIVVASEATSTFQTSNLEAPAKTGDALASFLLGYPTSGLKRNTLEREHGGWVDGAYVQDQFQMTPRLTLNAGLRWDSTIWPVYGYLDDGQGYVGDMNLINGTYIISAAPPACSPTVGVPCIPGGTLPTNVVVTPNKSRAMHNTDWSNWQIRLGIAYHVMDKTSVLAGFGRFYDNWSIATQISQNVGGTWPSQTLINKNSLNTTSPTVNLGDPLSLGSSVIQPAATPFNNATFYFNPGMKTPYADQWNLGIEQGFGSNTVLSIKYVGSHGGRLDLGGLKNTAEYPAAGTAAQVAARRMYPYIIPTNFDDSTGNSNYNALQATLRKSTSNGLTYLISYTWSKSIDLACSGSFGSEGCQLQDAYHPQKDRSVSGYDLPQILSASAVYELPFGTGRTYHSDNRFVNSSLGGWDINSIVSFSSGTPYTLTVSGDIANTGNTFVRPNLVGNPTPAHQSPTQWFNQSAFSAPPAYTFGTFSRNALRTDGYQNLDLSIFKTFTIYRESSLQFRAEAFNATNTAIFAAPGNTVGTPTFGVVSSTSNTPRQMQFALKLQF
jgi:hypothetical protein